MTIENESRTSYLTTYNSVLNGRRVACLLKPPVLRGSAGTTSGSPSTTSPSNLNNVSFPPSVLILVPAALASLTLPISSANFESLSLSTAESNKTLKFLSDGYSNRAGGQGGNGGREYIGAGDEERGLWVRSDEDLDECAGRGNRTTRVDEDADR